MRNLFQLEDGMAIPRYNEMYFAFLTAIADGQQHSMADIVMQLSGRYSLSEAEKNEMLPSGSLTFNNRVAWTRTYLKKAGLIAAPARGMVQLTSAGTAVLANPPKVFDNHFLASFPGFDVFKKTSATRDDTGDGEEKDNGDESPQDVMDRTYLQIRQALADDILAEIMRKSPAFFERMVVQLLKAMGYGGSLEDGGIVTRYSGDEGIDGIIKQDKLGFDQIYIQAKRWDLETAIGRPEIQKFVGALAGLGANRGLFVTTARFSAEAVKYARKQHTTKIVLVDGRKLAELMMDHNLGVSPVISYELKRIDSDFFDESE